MSFIQILTSLLYGLLDIILAIPRLVLWFYELFSANAKAESARPALVLIEEELKNNGLLKDFNNELKGVVNLKNEVPIILENSKNDNISNNKDLFIDYVSAKAASPDYPLDQFSIDFAMFGKSSEFLFMVLAAVLFVWIGGFFFKSVWRYSYTAINQFNTNLGKIASWFALIMAIMQIMIIFLQQVFRANGFPLAFFGINILPDSDVITMPWFATELMFFNAIIIACACAFTFVEGGHVRVDLVYSALGKKKKALLDIIGTVIFLLPSMAALWWLSWHLAINKIMTVTNFNHLTTLMTGRDVIGRIPGASSFKGWNWTVSTGETFTGVPLYFFLLLVLAALMFLQGVSFLLESTDKFTSKESEDK